jgi:hypothetical protein
MTSIAHLLEACKLPEDWYHSVSVISAMTASTPKFKELMSQLKEETQAKVVVQGKKKLDDRYTFNQGWYDALLNTDMVLNTHPEAQKLTLIPDECRQIVEIGIYEGASSCFWSDFYLSTLIHV